MKFKILFTAALFFTAISFAQQPRAEYPRPQFERDAWVNLNGEWSFTLDLSNSGADRDFYDDRLFG